MPVKCWYSWTKVDSEQSVLFVPWQLLKRGEGSLRRLHPGDKTDKNLTLLKMDKMQNRQDNW
jgi:hypothetical protein